MVNIFMLNQASGVTLLWILIARIYIGNCIRQTTAGCCWYKQHRGTGLDISVCGCVEGQQQHQLQLPHMWCCCCWCKGQKYSSKSRIFWELHQFNVFGIFLYCFCFLKLCFCSKNELITVQVCYCICVHRDESDSAYGPFPRIGGK